MIIFSLLLVSVVAALRDDLSKVESWNGSSTGQPSINSTKDGPEKWGILDWNGCEMYNNMRILGTRSLCFKANAVAYHCVSVVDVENVDEDEGGECDPMLSVGCTGVNVNVTANWDRKDLLMLDPWSRIWVP